MLCVRANYSAFSLPVGKRCYINTQGPKIWTQQVCMLSFVLTLCCSVRQILDQLLTSIPKEKNWTWWMLFQVVPTTLISPFAFDGVSAGSSSAEVWLALSKVLFLCGHIPQTDNVSTWSVQRNFHAHLFFNIFSCQEDTSGDYKTALLNLCGSDWQTLGGRCWKGYREKINSEQGSENVLVENLSIDPSEGEKKINLMVEISKALWRMWMLITYWMLSTSQGEMLISCFHFLLYIFFLF